MIDFSHLSVRFFSKPVEDKKATAQEGRPIMRDVEMCELRTAGDPKSVLVVPAHSYSTHRGAGNERLTYAEVHETLYERYKAGQGGVMSSGTPIAEAPFLTEAKREELRRLNILSVEQLAALDGTNLQRLGHGGRELKNKAQGFIDTAKGFATQDEMRRENAELRDQIARLEALVTGGAPATEPTPDAQSPFALWDEAAMKTWFEENAGKPADGRWSIDRLRQECDTANAELKSAEQSKAA